MVLTMCPRLPGPSESQVKAFVGQLETAPAEVLGVFVALPEEGRRRLLRNLRVLLSCLDDAGRVTGVLQDGISAKERRALEWVQSHMPTELVAVGHALLDIDARDTMFRVLQQLFNKRRPATPCSHERLDEDGICRSCGNDCRGVY
jgi:hypothetical protein